jgi:gliding motility-associated-like protein
VDSDWDISGGSTNTIAEDSLKAWRWASLQWQNPSLGTVNITSNTVSVTGLTSAAGPWTLKGAEPPPPIPCGEFYLPNAFSPNADAKNDFFRPRNNCIKVIDFKIYNRWGNLVFETTDPLTKGWDGSTPEGKNASSEVFVYMLKATLTNGQLIDLKGNVTLLK